MNSTKSIDVYMSYLLKKNSKEDKTMFMGDFNIDLLKYGTNADRTAFSDSQPHHRLLHTQKHSLIIYFQTTLKMV